MCLAARVARVTRARGGACVACKASSTRVQHLWPQLERPELQVAFAEVEAELVDVEVLEVRPKVLLHPVAKDFVPHPAQRQGRYPPRLLSVTHENSKHLTCIGVAATGPCVKKKFLREFLRMAPMDKAATPRDGHKTPNTALRISATRHGRHQQWPNNIAARCGGSAGCAWS